MSSSTQVVIIGAGPYGLSLAAHLREKGVPFRIFGGAMETWSTQMPKGMKLKSDGFASNLDAGEKTSYTLEDFCRETGKLYHPTQHPVALEDFVAYGQEFARRFVPGLEPQNISLVEPVTARPLEGTQRFRLRVETGEVFYASDVVIAVGLSQFSYIPEMLRDLPGSLVTHTSDHRTFDEFRMRDVTVLGRGASALNAAALLNENGARTTLISRERKLHIHKSGFGAGRSLMQRVLHPTSPLGPSMRSFLASQFPAAFHALPRTLRRVLIYRHLGPAGGSALRGRIHGKLPTLLGWSILDAEVLSAADPTERRIKLTLVDDQEQVREHVTSHIIAGTGFRMDMNRLRFVSPSLLAILKLEWNGAPALDRHFGSSVPGLYFVGPAASASFGPLMRFAAGAPYAATKLTARLAKLSSQEGYRAESRAYEQANTRERRAA